MQHFRRWTKILTTAFLFVFLLAPIPALASTPAQTIALCGAAERLIQQGYPQQARSALAAATDDDPCVGVTLTAATSAIASAQDRLDEANKYALFGYDQSALAAAKAAAKLDKENAAAATLVGVLSTEDDESAAQVATTGWDAFVERTLTPLQSLIIPVLAVLLAGFLLARLLVVVRPDPHRVRPAPFGAAMIGGGVVLLAVGAGVVAAVNGYPTWSGLIPAGLLSAAACGAGIAALIVLGFGIVSDARRSLLALLGLVVAWVSCCCLVWGLATQSEGGPYWLAPLAVLVGLPALALLAMTWASRLRLTIDARKESGKTDEILSGQVIALLAEMAGGNPKGLEVPRGVDLSVLSNIPISGLPEGKFAAALTALWQTFFALTPWQIRADISGTSACSVVITRNGRTVQTAVIDRAALALEPVKVAKDDDEADAAQLTDDARNHQLQVMVCAITLITLATRHRGFDGLLGAEDWRSIGLHYVATKNTTDPKLKKRLLAAAVHQEPTNVAAQVALRHAHNRESHERAELMDYATWLAVTNTRIKERVRANAGRKQRQAPGPSGGGAGNWLTGAASEGIDDQRRAYERDPSFALRLRMLNTLLSVYCNANAPTDSNDPNHIRGRNLTDADHGQASGAVDELVWMITCAPESSRVLAEALKISVATSAVDAFATKSVQPAAHSQLEAFIGSPGAMVDIGPYSAYNLACHFAASSDFATAIKYLKFADADDYLVGWRDRDPWLVKLRAEPVYHQAFDAKKRADIFALAPFEGLEKDLLAGGLGTAAKIAAVAPAHLAQVAGIKIWKAQRLVGIADLAQSVWPADAPDAIRGLRWEFCAGLLAEGVESRSDLNSLPATERCQLLAKIAKDLQTRYGVDLAEVHEPLCGQPTVCTANGSARPAPLPTGS